MNIKISRGNSKLGEIPNISLIPVKDCANCESCKDSCYALKAWKMYPRTRAAWRINSRAFRDDLQQAMSEVLKWFMDKSHNTPRFFRVHVAGDFLSQQHVNFWMLVADTIPGVKFLAFTKRHDLLYRQAPANLQVVLSMFPGMPEPRGFSTWLPRAWVSEDKAGNKESRVPSDAIECPGHCDSCAMCWHLKDLGRDVVFPFH